MVQEERAMRSARVFMGLVLLGGVCVGVLIWRPWARNGDDDASNARKQEYFALMSLPRHPPFYDAEKNQQEYLQQKRLLRQEYDRAKEQLSRGQPEAAWSTFSQVRASAAAKKATLRPTFLWHYGFAGAEAGALKNLAEITERAGRPGEAKTLSEEASLVEAAGTDFMESWLRFSKDASWPALKREWLSHKYPVLRLCAIHAASVGAANGHTGYDREEILTALRDVAQEDEVPALREWATAYVKWLDGIGD